MSSLFCWFFSFVFLFWILLGTEARSTQSRSHILSPFLLLWFFFKFWGRVSISCPGCHWTCNASASFSQVTRNIGMSYWVLSHWSFIFDYFGFFGAGIETRTWSLLDKVSTMELYLIPECPTFLERAWTLNLAQHLLEFYFNFCDMLFSSPIHQFYLQ